MIEPMEPDREAMDRMQRVAEAAGYRVIRQFIPCTVERHPETGDEWIMSIAPVCYTARKASAVAKALKPEGQPANFTAILRNFDMDDPGERAGYFVAQALQRAERAEWGDEA